MEIIFWELLNRSIAAGWLILAVMVLRLLLRKAPKWLPCVLWAIVAIRLLCPFSFESAFHPLIWAAYILFCRDIEFACDEKAVKDMNLNGKKAYYRALLACNMPGRVMVSYPLAFGEGRVKERVKHVLHYQKPVFWAVIASVGVCVVMAVCFLTNPKEDVLVEEERNDNDIQMAGTDDRENHDDGETQPAFGELISISRAGNPPDLQTMFRDFGIAIQLLGNGNWIQDREYRQPDEKHMEIYYHDAILNADCKLLVVRDGMPELPDTIFDESLEETWEGAAVSGQKVFVRV